MGWYPTTGETTERARVKPPGRIPHVRLPLAYVRPLSRGLRRADARDARCLSSNPMCDLIRNSGLALWMHLGTPWGNLGDRVWIERARGCGLPEDQRVDTPSDQGIPCPKGVEENRLTLGVEAFTHRSSKNCG